MDTVYHVCYHVYVYSHSVKLIFNMFSKLVYSFHQFLFNRSSVVLPALDSLPQCAV